MTVVAERVFTPADQQGFAALSGDFNPMHMDEVAARRTVVGAPVVHGVHLLCWALESWIASTSRASVALNQIVASFHRGVLVGEVVRTSVVADAEEFILKIQRPDGSEMTSIRGKLGSTVPYRENLPAMGPTECREIDPGELANTRGSLPLALCQGEASRLFPRLSEALPALQLAALLATTRLVGMECPGLHSLYAGLELSFCGEAIGMPQLNYRVSRADRSGVVSLAVDGPGFQGKVRAMLRPTPRKQRAARELATLVADREFSGQRALIVGGSRGLGEVTAKLLAVGGADVTITYHRGKPDAEAVAAEINSAGRKCEIARFDSTHPERIGLSQAPTDVYYFATPRITADKRVLFSAERFAEYCHYYVTGFAETLLALAEGMKTIGVFYPSTVFLDDAPLYMAEYCAAKAAGEEVCRQLKKQLPNWRFYAPRLPRMHTDQTNGILAAEMEPADIVMLRHLREMSEASSAGMLTAECKDKDLQPVFEPR